MGTPHFLCPAHPVHRGLSLTRSTWALAAGHRDRCLTRSIWALAAGFDLQKRRREQLCELLTPWTDGDVTSPSAAA